MKRLLQGSAGVLVALGMSGIANAGIIYVKNDATGSNTGGSWTNAFTDLQDALDTATDEDEIWVCGGTVASPRIYKPVQPGATQDRTKSFIILAGVELYGGFAGTETSEQRSLRNEVTQPTILDGDIGTANVASDNSYHVVVIKGNDLSGTKVSGVTIQNGNADATSGDHQYGGGILISPDDPDPENHPFLGPNLDRLIIQDNKAYTAGGALRSHAHAESKIANIKVLPLRTIRIADDVRAISGGDICVCNQLLDGLARRHLKRDCDLDGGAAASGTMIAGFAEALAERLGRQAGLGRSLGSTDEPHAWTINAPAGARPADVLASATDAIGRTIAARLPACHRVLLAGGGAANRALRAAIARHASAAVEETDALGMPGRYREAAQIAVLGALCEDGVAITLPQVTGVAAPAPLAANWAGVSRVNVGYRGE